MRSSIASAKPVILGKDAASAFMPTEYCGDIQLKDDLVPLLEALPSKEAAQGNKQLRFYCIIAWPM